MKIKTANAYQFLRHCKALHAICNPTRNTWDGGLPEILGQEYYHKFNRLEKKLHRLAEIACNGELTAREEKEEARLTAQARAMIKPEYQNQFFVNGDPRGYALKMKRPGGEAGTEARAKAEKWQPLPEGLYQDFGGYGILAPEF